jgi:hypothetical protein
MLEVFLGSSVPQDLVLLATLTEDSLYLLSMIHAHRNDTVGIPEAVLLSGIRVAIGKSILHLPT